MGQVGLFNCPPILLQFIRPDLGRRAFFFYRLSLAVTKGWFICFVFVGFIRVLFFLSFVVERRAPSEFLGWGPFFFEGSLFSCGGTVFTIGLRGWCVGRACHSRGSFLLSTIQRKSRGTFSALFQGCCPVLYTCNRQFISLRSTRRVMRSSLL